VPTRSHLSLEAEREDREDQERLRAIDSRLTSLDGRRRELIERVRAISAEQKALYDHRQSLQSEVESRYEDHGRRGKRLTELRSERDAARKKVEAIVIRRRELLLSFPSTDRLRPDLIRREIAELELRQQTRALKLDEENALIARLRQRSQELKAAEAQSAVVLEHARQRKEADQAVNEARATVERLAREAETARSERDSAMKEIRSLLENAGAIVADMRAKGTARAEVIRQIDTLDREMDTLEREGREVFQRSRNRREEARRLMRSFSRPRERPPAELLATAADARFEELMKRGKVTLA
jgi:uncharacterized coiled-coil DUF342 family protein